MASILITGATGFLGSFLVEEALRRDMEVWAAVRPTSNLQYLQDSRINTINLDLSSEARLVEAFCGRHFDYVIHAAGATKALKRETFYKVNTDGTANLARALKRTVPSVRKFVFVSSLSVCGPVNETLPYREITLDDIPQPNTAYGMSKLEAEKWLVRECPYPYTILRPTGIYGPREKDYMLMADSIRKGMDVAVGTQRQDITFVYVTDVVQAAFLALDNAKSDGGIYFLTDGEVYTSRTFSDYIIEELGKKRVLRLTFPIGILKTVCAVSDVMMRVTGKLSTLNNDHFNILKQRNWRCDISPAVRDLGYTPKVKLREGVHRMLCDK